jgi:hypothetical protein
MQRSPTELIAPIKGSNDISSIRGAPRLPGHDKRPRARAEEPQTGYTRKRRSRRELESTLTDESAMATAAYTGSSSMPKVG